MKKFFKVAMFASLISMFAHAEDVAITPGVYGPLYVVDAEYGFTKVNSDVTLALAYEGLDKPVLTLDYLIDDAPEHVVLNVYNVELDACGSKHVYARLTGEDAVGGARYNVHFVDHATNTCDMVRAWLWEADVRMGFGWCGTGDSTMTLQGNAY
jgi:hypothetical protein